MPDDLQARLLRLPTQHLVALRAAFNGLDDDAVAALLGIPPEAVRPTLRLAAAKLLAVLETGTDEEDVPPC